MRYLLRYLRILLALGVLLLPLPLYAEDTPDGCQTVGTMQMCWGSKTLPRNPNALHTATFSFTFPKEFGSVPVVTQAINVNGRGHAMGVYAWRLTTKQYEGKLNNMYIAVPVDGVITMSYMAIGQAAR